MTEPVSVLRSQEILRKQLEFAEHILFFFTRIVKLLCLRVCVREIKFNIIYAVSVSDIIVIVYKSPF